MNTLHHSLDRILSRWPAMLLAILALPLTALRMLAQDSAAGGEANLKVPDLSQVTFLNGIPGDKLLLWGLLICAFGLIFGVVIYAKLKALPVHQSMLEVSELIYETCKTYLTTQGKFILLLEVFIGLVIVLYFGYLLSFAPMRVVDHSRIQPAGHRGELRRGVVRHSRQHVRELAHGVREPSRQAVSLLRDSAQRGNEHRDAADQHRARS